MKLKLRNEWGLVTEDGITYLYPKAGMSASVTEFLVCSSILEAHECLINAGNKSPWEEVEFPLEEVELTTNKMTTVLATVSAVINGQLIAYSIVIRRFPDSEHEWSLPDGTMSVSYHPSKNTIGIAKHEVGADRTLLDPIDIPLDYDGDGMPTSSDVGDYEWDELFTECGRVWPEFHESRGSYVKRIHLISKLLEAAGVR